MCDKKQIFVRKDTITMFYTDNYVPDRKEPYNGYNSLGFLKSYAYYFKDKYWTKAIFGDWCTKIGLVPGKEYFIRDEYYYQQYIQHSEGDEIVLSYVPDNTKMGFIRKADGRLLYGSDMNISDHQKLGCRTMLFFIGYDTEGNNVGIYFPCPPNELEWHFFWFDM